ncbi:hypothetical protein [Aestuariirhabdus sp. LZHN29]
MPREPWTAVVAYVQDVRAVSCAPAQSALPTSLSVVCHESHGRAD